MAPSMKHRDGLLCVVCMLSAAWRADGHAQVMNDPTRPPAAVHAPDAGDAAARGPVLQSVMITPAQRSAIIGGEHVTLGGTYRDARVIKITESEVVLRTAGGTETLKMYPDVDMNAVKSPEPVRPKPVSQKRRHPQITPR